MFLGLSASQETHVRVRCAMAQMGITADQKVTVRVSEHTGTASGFDLAIAMAVLGALGKATVSEHVVYVGELSLDGRVRPVRGMLQRLLAASKHGFHRAVVPCSNQREAAAVQSVASRVAPTLESAVTGDMSPALEWPASSDRQPNMTEVLGLKEARRALVIAAAGDHNVLIVGGPGSGKTALARRLTSIMPDMTDEERMEASIVHSNAGLLREGLLVDRPFRAPHHTVSDSGMVGGGKPARPGEVSLAHGGVLFLDELPEFRRSTLEGLTHALKAKRSLGFPSWPLVVGGMNPCPCGHHGSPRTPFCVCTPERIKAWFGRVPANLFDIVVRLPHYLADSSSSEPAESSSDIRERVTEAQHRFQERSKRVDTLLEKPEWIEKEKEINGATVLRVARAIADLDGSDYIKEEHSAEAARLVFIGGQS